MNCATFGASSALMGRKLTFDDGQFSVDGFGAVATARVLRYEDRGELEWEYAGLSEWAREVYAFELSQNPPAEHQVAAAPEASTPVVEALATISGCHVKGGEGLPPKPGDVVSLVFNPDNLLLQSADGVLAEISYADVESLEIGGPGKFKSGGGFMGGGFGAEGAVEGMAIASALNLLTTRTKPITTVTLRTRSAELFLYITTETPELLRMRLSPVFNVMRQHEQAPATQQVQGSGDAVERLASLAGLLEKDLITREEFDRLKADLVGLMA